MVVGVVGGGWGEYRGNLGLKFSMGFLGVNFIGLSDRGLVWVLDFMINILHLPFKLYLYNI